MTHERKFDRCRLYLRPADYATYTIYPREISGLLRYCNSPRYDWGLHRVSMRAQIVLQGGCDILNKLSGPNQDSG